MLLAIRCHDRFTSAGILPEDVTYIAGEHVADAWNCYPWDAKVLYHVPHYVKISPTQNRPKTDPPNPPEHGHTLLFSDRIGWINVYQTWAAGGVGAT